MLEFRNGEIVQVKVIPPENFQSIQLRSDAAAVTIGHRSYPLDAILSNHLEYALSWSDYYAIVGVSRYSPPELAQLPTARITVHDGS